MRVNRVAAQTEERSEHGEDEAERDARLVGQAVHGIQLVRQNPLDVVNRDIQVVLVGHDLPPSRPPTCSGGGYKDMGEGWATRTEGQRGRTENAARPTRSDPC